MEERRLIDANELMDVIRQHEYRLATKQGSIDYGMFTLRIQQSVDEQPTVDAVEVVRCRECEFRSSWMMNRNLRYICPESGMFPNCENDFCSYGKPKEELEVLKYRIQCPFGGDETNDCADCAYSGDFHFAKGECQKRDNNPELMKGGDEK